MDLRPFQKRFLQQAFAPQITTAILSIPRGNGKSYLAAHVLERALTPGDPLFQPGGEVLLGSSTLEQSRNVFRPLRAALEPTGRLLGWIDRSRGSAPFTRHPIPGCVLRRVMPREFWLGRRQSLVIIDEPGAFEVVGGQLLHDALQTAMGKPESPLRVIYIGTIAPSSRGWWADLVDGGSHDSVYVQSLQGDPKKWDQWPEIKRCNPLMSRFPESRAKLLEERDEARQDGRLIGEVQVVQIKPANSGRGRDPVEPGGLGADGTAPHPGARRPAIVGIDLGGGRAWSAACAIWQSGRVEALAVAPGVPSLEEQERRDRVPAGAYRTLEHVGTAHGGRGPTSPVYRLSVGCRASRVGASGPGDLRQVPAG